MGLIAPTALFVLLPLIWGINQLGWHAAAQVPLWIGPILLYVLLPLLDLGFGPDGQNPPDEVMELLENDKYYRYCTYVYIPFQYLSVVFGAYLFTASNLTWLGFDTPLSWAGKLGVALARVPVGVVDRAVKRGPGRELLAIALGQAGVGVVAIMVHGEHEVGQVGL